MPSAKKPLSDSDYLRLADFRCALLRFLEFSETAAAEEGLTPKQHQALLAIRGNPQPPASVGYLAERLRIRPNTAAELSQRLEQAGLISRKANANDKRLMDLELTAEAKTKLEALSQVHREELVRHKPEMLRVLENLDTEGRV